MTLNTKTLRTMWNFVETSNPRMLLKLSDEEIVARLIKQVQALSYLDSDDRDILSRYISSRTSLIKDLAYSKVS